MAEIKRQPLLRDYQMDAVDRMFSGCILNGGVGSGKSRTALYFYFKEQGGKIDQYGYKPMTREKKLFIITTAKKRDSLEWEGELVPFLIDKEDVVIDSWNNIKKYSDVKGAFFIFDEQRVVGYGSWVKAFIKIARVNDWVLLSATPGDTWMDYVPVFIANGFYRNKTEFCREHVIYKRFAKFPQIDRYINTGRLIRLRNKLLIDMDFHRETVRHHVDIWCDYDKPRYKEVTKLRWNPFDDCPIASAGELCYVWRKIVNLDETRLQNTLVTAQKAHRAIIFYNYDYELEALKTLPYGDDFEVAEWNGHKHQEIPKSENWVYLVQYNAGAEGWNCIKTDTIIFFSQNYSYKMVEQACGRIDRMNTPYKDLYYYHMKSRSGIDLAIGRALANKKKFNESNYSKKIVDPVYWNSGMAA